jgi:rubrerythrin
MAGLTQNEDLRKVLLDVAKEEKTHVGEFQAMLLRIDPEQAKELKNGKKEVDEMMEK